MAVQELSRDEQLGDDALLLRWQRIGADGAFGAATWWRAAAGPAELRRRAAQGAAARGAQRGEAADGGRQDAHDRAARQAQVGRRRCPRRRRRRRTRCSSATATSSSCATPATPTPTPRRRRRGGETVAHRARRPRPAGPGGARRRRRRRHRRGGGGAARARAQDPHVLRRRGGRRERVGGVAPGALYQGSTSRCRGDRGSGTASCAGASRPGGRYGRHDGVGRRGGGKLRARSPSSPRRANERSTELIIGGARRCLAQLAPVMSSPSGLPALRAAPHPLGPAQNGREGPSRALTPRFHALGDLRHSGAPAQPRFEAERHEGDRPDARHGDALQADFTDCTEGLVTLASVAAPLPRRRRRPPQDRPRSPGLLTVASKLNERMYVPLGRSDGTKRSAKCSSSSSSSASSAGTSMPRRPTRSRNSLGGDLRVRRSADYRRAAQARGAPPARPRGAPARAARPRSWRNSAQFCEI